MRNERFESQSLGDWLCYLEQLHPAEIELGLSRVTTLATKMALTKPGGQVVLIGGTNGKGSTVALMERACLAQGLTTGIYASPHLLRYNERVRINGLELDDGAHCAAFAAVEAERGDIALTYFEFGTLAALWLIKQAGVDVALLEVGLGGRLDATNIVDADVSVITSVDLDHQSFLGNTRESVGFEKAGIFRAGRPAVVGEPDIPTSVSARIEAIQAVPCRVGGEFSYHKQQERWQWSMADVHLTDLPLPQIPLANAATALAALCHLHRLPETATLKQVLAETVLAGRFQTIGEQPRVILDVGHNPHAARYLAQRLAAIKGQGQVIALAAMLADKDIVATLNALLPVVDLWLVASLPVARGAKAEVLAAALAEQGVDCEAFDSVKAAYDHALAHAGTSDVVIVFGSFYTVADMLA